MRSESERRRIVGDAIQDYLEAHLDGCTGLGSRLGTLSFVRTNGELYAIVDGRRFLIVVQAVEVGS